MKNILITNKEVILSMNKHTIDGLGGKEATVDVLYDCFLGNIAHYDNPAAPWHECSRSREDVSYWAELRQQVEAAKNTGELADMREEFYLSCRG